ncbi:MAG: hypothetical protein B7733_11955 [Myxococcales bacterium FL481]|nr:MAG: hypothetical protein B7733_11955 [Myxococcales bacterium FL481]
MPPAFAAHRPATTVLLVAALAGLFFASFSTYDFAQHLDRQVHDIHCSFVPGVVSGASEANSGCQVTMMSPYSSVLRKAMWGGLPISLPAMGVFAFLFFRGLWLLGRANRRTRAAALAVLLTATVCLAATVVMAGIAFVTLGAACKLCIGIYCASVTAFIASLLIWRSTKWQEHEPGVDDSLPREMMSAGAQLSAFVAVPAAIYVLLMPDHSQFVGTCGRIDDAKDPYGVMVPIGPQSGVPSIEVFDPLCPACRGFERRLVASRLDRKLARQAVLFPLDDRCNWMISKALHPGACTISEAVLCAAEHSSARAEEVIAWAFDQQDQIRAATVGDPEAAAKLVAAAFPQVASCLGSAKVQQRLNRSLRWTVKNQIPVLTPQLYVAGRKLCDEDTDLGLDFALSRMLDMHARGELETTSRKSEASP